MEQTAEEVVMEEALEDLLDLIDLRLQIIQETYEVAAMDAALEIDRLREELSKWQH